MPSDSHSRSKSHSKQSRRDRYDDRDRDSSNRADDARSRKRRHEKEDAKKSRKKDRDVERHRYSSSRKYSDKDVEAEIDEKDDRNTDDRSNKKTRRSDSPHRSRGKSSNKKKNKHSRNRGSRYSDDHSSRSSDYEKHRRKKKYSKFRHERNDKKSSKAGSVKKPDKSKLFPMGEPFGRIPASKLDAKNDYFSFHQEFSIYLFREEGTCFNDINTEEARSAFARFAKQYNTGMLEEAYYNRKFPNEVIEESKKTKHSWSFRTTATERKGLGDLQKGVRRQTEFNSNRGAEPKLDVKDPNNTLSSDV